MNVKISNVFIAMLFLFSMLSPLFVNHEPVKAASSLYVSGDEDAGWYDASHVATVQEGVDNATSGDTVYIWEGTYTEQVTVGKTLNIIGNNSKTTIIDAAESGCGITVEGGGEHTNISGLLLRNSTPSGTSSAGVLIKTDNITIFDCYFTDNYEGIRSENHSDNISIHNSTFIENLDCGVYLGKWVSSTEGIESNHTVIRDNYFDSNGDIGIYLNVNCNDSLITGNIVINHAIPDWDSDNIHIYKPQNVTVYNNYLANYHGDNERIAFDNGTNNVWNITKTAGKNIVGGDYLGGNYFYNYNGTDSDADGLGDTKTPWNSTGRIGYETGESGAGDYLPLILADYDHSDMNRFNGWSYKKKITLNSSQIPGTLTNFPVCINITDTDLRDKAAINGYDIAFLDSTENTQYHHEIEEYDTLTGHLVAWVNVTSLVHDADTEIWMYYGNDSFPHSQENVSNTWNSDYISVYHGVDTVDSTGNKNLTNEDADIDDDSIIGGAFEFNNDDDEYMYADEWYDLDTGDKTYSLVCLTNIKKIDETGDNRYVGIKLNGPMASEKGLILRYRKNTTDLISAVTWDDSGENEIRAEDPVTYGQWYLLGSTYTESQMQLFMDGDKVNTTSTTWDFTDFDNNSIWIGRVQNYYYNGSFDEIRISKVVRSDNWMKTVYNNLFNATIGGFYGLGLEEEVDRSTTWSGWSDGWTISDSHSCRETGYLYGNWSFSEHMSGGTLEEAWSEANDSHWSVTDHSIWWDGNNTYELNTTDVNSSFTVLNDSGMNRSQVFGWVHSNDTETDALYPFVIFAYNNSQDFDCVMWSSLEVWLLNWDGTNMTDIYSGAPVVDPFEDATDVSNQWIQEGVYLTDEGNYYKLIYNEHNGSLKFKWWGGGFMNEPVGWATDYIHTNLTHDTCRCHGIGAWNPNEKDTTMQWDLLNIWQLNYTVNTSDWCNISGNNESRPHMDFPVIDLGTWSEEIMSYFNATADGNVSIDDIRTIMKDNITNPMNMESRMFELKSSAQSTGYQNDTVYYYGCILDNFSSFSEETPYDEWLHLHVQMCPDDQVRTDEYGDFLIGIDVDNDRTWDVNDRAYWAYVDDEGDIWTQTYNGNGDAISNVASVNIWSSDTAAVGNLHRYNSHLNYAISIPLADLVNESGSPLNVSDVFGLNIMTSTAGDVIEEYACVWQNWNETTEGTYWDEKGAGFITAMEYFFEYDGEHEGPCANTTTLERWGEGEIIGTINASGNVSYNMSVNASFNMSSSTADEGWVHMNTTINVTNDGAGSLNDIYVNISWWNCSCSDLNMTLLDSNQNESNWTLFNDSCYAIIHNTSIEPLAAGNTWNIWFIVNITNCSGVTSATETMNITANATELSEDVVVDGDDAPSFTFGLAATRVCVTFLTGMADAEGYGTTVFNVIGAVIAIGAILSLIAIFTKSGLFKK